MFNETDSHLPGYAIFILIPLEVLVWLCVELPELLDNILTDIAIILLNLPSYFQVLLGRDIHHFPALAHEVEDKLCDIAASDRNMLDSTANDIALRAGNDVRDTISRVDDRSCQGAVRDAIGCP